MWSDKLRYNLFLSITQPRHKTPKCSLFFPKPFNEKCQTYSKVQRILQFMPISTIQFPPLIFYDTCCITYLSTYQSPCRSIIHLILKHLK